MRLGGIGKWRTREGGVEMNVGSDDSVGPMMGGKQSRTNIKASFTVENREKEGIII